MPPTKVFVGNLSFKTKESALAEHFQPYKVASVHIITRGPRSLGYGFIELDTEELAHNAVNDMNKKSIDGREINVELAKPRQATPKNPRPTRVRGRGGSSGSNRNSPVVPPNQENNQNADNQNSDGQNAKPVQRSFRKRYGRRPRGQQPKQAQQNQDAGDAPENTNNNKPRQAPNQAQGQQNEGGTPRGGRRRRVGPRGRGFYERPRNNANRIESPTSLFVANLPFDLKEDRLLELFKEFNATKAHVVTNYQGRSRGFGFVEFGNEKDQQAAFNSTNQNKIVVSDRTLTVKLVQLKEKAGPDSVPPETNSTVAPVSAPATI